MSRFSIKKWLSNISISRKLYFTIGIMSLLIFLQMAVFWFCFNTLSAVRGYVSGEGLWSKAQKDAVFHLRSYAYSHDENDYRIFLEKLKVNHGDQKTRLELEKDKPDFEVARRGFLEGRNHPDDIEGMINVFVYFRHIYYIDKAISIWAEADSVLAQLEPIAGELKDAVHNDASQETVNSILRKTEPINIRLTELEDEFSFTLGEGSRWLEELILTLLISLTLTVLTACILITLMVSKGIEKGLKEIIRGANLISRGDLKQRVEVYSNDEVGSLAISFNQMTCELEENIHQLKEAEENLRQEKNRAEASEKVKQVFLANMSHEIRTPMNAILGFARLMEDSSLNKEQKEYIRAIVKSGDNLLVILNDILDFSKIEAGKITFEQTPFNIKDVVESTIVMLRAKAEAKNLALTYMIDDRIPAILTGDSIRLNQVLLNLVSNAIKFTDVGYINVSVLARWVDDDEINLEFIVKDTGIGISPEQQVRVFESFEQATLGTTRKYGGTGLGLTIVKQLVELQGGRVYLNSKPGEGSEFCFMLPYSTTIQQMIRRPKPEAKHQNAIFENPPLKILIVEDNALNQLLVKRVLEKRGFATEIAENGRVALQLLGKKEFDMVLMDLQMPVLDGYDTTRIIRRMEGQKRYIPIIAMTAHTIKGEVEKCMDIGMSDHISKPFVPDVLEKKILDLALSARNN
jgi:signal transduction histidine kinase/ActR/RegA family two-component response regulator